MATRIWSLFCGSAALVWSGLLLLLLYLQPHNEGNVPVFEPGFTSDAIFWIILIGVPALTIAVSGILGSIYPSLAITIVVWCVTTFLAGLTILGILSFGAILLPLDGLGFAISVLQTVISTRRRSPASQLTPSRALRIGSVISGILTFLWLVLLALLVYFHPYFQPFAGLTAERIQPVVLNFRPGFALVQVFAIVAIGLPGIALVVSALCGGARSSLGALIAVWIATGLMGIVALFSRSAWGAALIPLIGLGVVISIFQTVAYLFPLGRRPERVAY